MPSARAYDNNAGACSLGRVGVTINEKPEISNPLPYDDAAGNDIISHF